jgi:hypothetical protein
MDVLIVERASCSGTGGRTEVKRDERGARTLVSTAANRLVGFSFLLLGIRCVCDGGEVEILIRGLQAWPSGASQLLLRAQGPRGPIAIACPVSTPNQSLRSVTRLLWWRVLS